MFWDFLKKLLSKDHTWSGDQTFPTVTLSDLTASLPVFTTAAKKLESKSLADTFSVIKQAATTEATGVVELTTDAEVRSETAYKIPDASQLPLSTRKVGPPAEPAEGTLSTVGTSTTVTLSSAVDYEKIQPGSTIIANSLTRYVLTKDGSNEVTINVATDFSATYSFTYQNPITVFEASDGSIAGWIRADKVLNVNNKIFIDGIARVYYPDQADFLGTMYLGNGNGGASLSHTKEDEGRYNTFIGIGAGNANTTGTQNTANGGSSLSSNTTGTQNTANGYLSLSSNTTGNYNTANGSYSLSSNTTGTQNTANGYLSLFSNTTGTQNTANGRSSLSLNTTGNYNTGLGYKAGQYITGGAAANAAGSYNIFLGSETKALANGDENEIVIGYDATGIGSNSVVLGNDSVATTALRGNVGFNTSSFGTSAAGILAIAIGTAPTTAPADMAQMGVSDYAAGDARWWFIGEKSTAKNILGDGEIGVENENNDGGFFPLKRYKSSVEVTAVASLTITLSIPTGAKLKGVQLHVKTALAAGETWDAEFNDGAQVEVIGTTIAVAQNTNVNFFSAGVETDATTNIVITKTGGGAFTAQGEIEAVAYVEEFTAWTDEA